MTVRVLQVLGRSAGGIARHVAQVVDALDGRDGVVVDVAGPRDLPVAMPKRVIDVVIPDGPTGGHRRAVSALRRVVEAGRYEVVHAHGLRAGIDAALAARSQRVPPVVTVHNLVRPDVTGPVRAIGYRWAEPLAVGLSALTFAVSEDMARHLRRVARRFAHKVEVLYVAIDAPSTTRPRDEVRRELGVDDRSSLIVTASRLAPQKDLPVMLEALARLEDGAVLALLGEGPLEHQLRGLAQDLGVASRVKFLGFRSDAADFVAAGDVFCLSSRWEGFPLALQEAIMLGVPVVATDVGGARELITDGISGRLVPKRDPEALAGALHDVIASDETRRAYAERARADLADRVSPERMLHRLVNAYREIARAR